MSDPLQSEFDAWLEAALTSARPPSIVAFNVNLYDSPFRADLVGATSYDPSDSDWACEEAWTPPRRLFDFPDSLASRPWRERLALADSLLRNYLQSTSAGAGALRKARAVTVGFVDGDLEVIHEGAV